MSTPDPADDVDRIRQARDDRAEDEPEVFVCPVDGCSRTVIGNPGDLRNHVRQAEDDAHRHRSMNEDLEVEFDEESYHAMWGPGDRDDQKMASPVSKSAAVVDW